MLNKSRLPTQGGTFTGSASKKKAAQRAAADAAVAALQRQPAWQAAVAAKARPKQESLLSAIADTLGDKVTDLGIPSPSTASNQIRSAVQIEHLYLSNYKHDHRCRHNS